jgi:hypothetical protein
MHTWRERWVFKFENIHPKWRQHRMGHIIRQTQGESARRNKTKQATKKSAARFDLSG